jgi:hypothetical protein
VGQVTGSGEKPQAATQLRLKRKTDLLRGRFLRNFEAKSGFLASLEGFEPTTRCLEATVPIFEDFCLFAS